MKLIFIIIFYYQYKSETAPLFNTHNTLFFKTKQSIIYKQQQQQQKVEI